MADDRATVLIVGGGFAGLELTRQLADAGVADVLVLEAGGDADLRHTNVAYDPETAVELWLRPAGDKHFRRPWDTGGSPHFAANAGIRARLGGRSLYWYGVCLPMEPWALTAPDWPAAVVADLTRTWRGGPPLYQRVAEDLGLSWVDGSTVAGPPTALGPFELRRTPRAVRTHPSAPGRWSAYSPLDRWRDPATGEHHGWPPGVRVRTGVEVRTVVLDGDGRATGVIAAPADGGPAFRVGADVVVLCAGTVESSRLAIQALAGRGAPARLGRLADHITQGFFVRLDATKLPRPLPVRPGSYLLPDPAGRSNLYLSVWRASRTEVVLDVKVAGEQTPSADSAVICRTDGEQPWPVRVRAALCDADRALIEAQRDLLRRFWYAVAAAFGLSGEPDFEPFEFPRSTNVAVLAREECPIGVPQTWASPLGAEDHEGGTLPLGTVLTADHELAGVPGLFAAGPATFARIGAANPSFTTIALARRLATILVDRLAEPTGRRSA